MISHLLISVVFYLVLLYLSINLLGFFVRGLFPDPELDRLKLEAHDFIKHEIEKAQSANTKINIIALTLLVIYFYLLFHFWNIGVVIVAILMMASRFPDLLWEIKHGKKLTHTDAKALPHNVLFYITSFSFLVDFPLLYYFLYYF
jgi:hypothetical protein